MQPISLLSLAALVSAACVEYNPEEVEELAPFLPYVEDDGSGGTDPEEFLELCYTQNPCAQRWDPDIGDYELDPDCNAVVEEPMQAIVEHAEDSVLTLENILGGGVDFTVVTVRSFILSEDGFGDPEMEIDYAKFFIVPRSYNNDDSFTDALNGWVHSRNDIDLIYGSLSGFPVDNVYCNARQWAGTIFYIDNISLETGYADAYATKDCALDHGSDPAKCMYVKGMIPLEGISDQREFVAEISASGEVSYGDIDYSGEETDFPVQDTVVVPLESAINDLLRTGSVYANSGKIIYSNSNEGDDFYYTVQVSVLEGRYGAE